MVVVVTHDTDVAGVADTRYTLHDGKLLAGESSSEVSTSSQLRDSG
jgi:ABC-type lipoprotein export system ATPase subunit